MMNNQAIRISPRKLLQNHLRVTVPIGTAPDGLPLLLFVDRGKSPEELLAPIASQLGYNNPDDYAQTPLSDILRQLEKIFNQRDIKSFDSPNGALECYVCHQPIISIVGPTLLERVILGFRGSRRTTLVPDTRPTAADTDKRSDATEGEAQQPPVRAEVGNLKLALPLDGSPAITVRCIEKLKHQFSFQYTRIFESESLSILKTACFHASNTNGDEESFSGNMNDKSAYINARQRCLESGSRYVFTCQIDRSEIVSLLIELCIELEKLHKSGEIHGDVKPSNALVTANGVRIIDSLRLKRGAKSPALTPGWAAPEQILRGDVDFPTDQYPLGLMLCKLVAGVQYGEELTFLVPTGASNLERFTLLRNPGVYIDPNTAPIDNKGISLWRNLIERCMQFYPQNRFPHMTDLLNELKEINSKYPVQGKSTIELKFGKLVMAKEEGRVLPMWLAEDWF